MAKSSISAVFLLLPNLTFAEPKSDFYSSGPVLTCNGQGVIKSGYDTVDGEIIALPDNDLEGHSPIYAIDDYAPAQIGISFGFYACRLAPDSPISLTATLNHPPMTFQGKTTVQQSWPIAQPAARQEHPDGEVCSFIGYKLEDDFELTVGDWVFSLWEQDELLLSETVQLVGLEETEFLISCQIFE